MCALSGVLDVVEDIAYWRLLEHLANERNGGCDILLHYIPRYLVFPALIYGLQQMVCFAEVCGVVVDVFWAIVDLRPLWHHYCKLDA